MNKKFILLAIFILIASVMFVSAQGENSLKSDFNSSSYDVISIDINWVGDTDDLRPDAVDVDIIADGTKLETVTITKANNWKLTTRLLCPASNDDGSDVVYNFTESDLDNYTLTKVVKNGVLDYTLTNQYTASDSNDTDTNTTVVKNNTDTNTTVVKNNTDTNSTKVHANKTTPAVKKNSTSVKKVQKPVSKNNKQVNKTHKPVKKQNETNKLLNTGNNLWIVVVCIIIIVAVVIYKKR